jgi:hypothetical protein
VTRDELREKVARAIWNASPTGIDDDLDWDALSTGAQDEVREQADAAIEAMGAGGFVTVDAVEELDCACLSYGYLGTDKSACGPHGPKNADYDWTKCWAGKAMARARVTVIDDSGEAG